MFFTRCCLEAWLCCSMGTHIDVNVCLRVWTSNTFYDSQLDMIDCVLFFHQDEVFMDPIRLHVHSVRRVFSGPLDDCVQVA